MLAEVSQRRRGKRSLLPVRRLGAPCDITEGLFFSALLKSERQSGRSWSSSSGSQGDVLSENSYGVNFAAHGAFKETTGIDQMLSDTLDTGGTLSPAQP